MQSSLLVKRFVPLTNVLVSSERISGYVSQPIPVADFGADTPPDSE